MIGYNANTNTFIIGGGTEENPITRKELNIAMERVANNPEL